MNVYSRYGLFVTGLLVNTFITESFRGLYLWYGTLIAIYISLLKRQLTNRLLVMSLGGLGHSFVHIHWPFLDAKNGYVPGISAFPDVLFHSFMLIFVWFNIRNRVSKGVNLVTIFCIFGSILNCIFTNFKTINRSTYRHLFFNNPRYLLFNLTTSFQAVSTAYWIAFALHYNKWHKQSFKYCLLLCNIVIVSNWFWYNCDDVFELGIGLIKMSMKYRYIEGLFIISTWIPLVFNY